LLRRFKKTHSPNGGRCKGERKGGKIQKGEGRGGASSLKKRNLIEKITKKEKGKPSQDFGKKKRKQYIYEEDTGVPQKRGTHFGQKKKKGGDGGTENKEIFLSGRRGRKKETPTTNLKKADKGKGGKRGKEEKSQGIYHRRDLTFNETAVRDSKGTARTRGKGSLWTSARTE